MRRIHFWAVLLVVGWGISGLAGCGSNQGAGTTNVDETSDPGDIASGDPSPDSGMADPAGGLGNPPGGDSPDGLASPGGAGDGGLGNPPGLGSPDGGLGDPPGLDSPDGALGDPPGLGSPDAALGDPPGLDSPDGALGDPPGLGSPDAALGDPPGLDSPDGADSPPGANPGGPNDGVGAPGDAVGAAAGAPGDAVGAAAGAPGDAVGAAVGAPGDAVGAAAGAPGDAGANVGGPNNGGANAGGRQQGRTARNTGRNNRNRNRAPSTTPPKKQLPKRKLLPAPPPRPKEVGLVKQVEPEDAEYLAAAEKLFSVGQDSDAFKYVDAAILTDDKVAELFPPYLVKGAKLQTEIRPAVRWGIGVIYLPPKGAQSSSNAPKLGLMPMGMELSAQDTAAGIPPKELTSPTAFMLPRLQEIKHTYETGQLVLHKINENRREGLYGKVLSELGKSRPKSTRFDPRSQSKRPPRPVFGGIHYLEVGMERELIRDAQALDLDVMVVFKVVVLEVKSRKTPRPDRVNRTSMHAFTVADGKEVYKSKEVESRKVYIDRVRNVEPDPVDAMVDDFFAFAEQNFQVEPLPDLTADMARKRAGAILAKKHENPLRALAELRYYHLRGVLDDQMLTTAYERVLGDPDTARRLVTGDPADKKLTLQKWLPPVAF